MQQIAKQFGADVDPALCLTPSKKAGAIKSPAPFGKGQMEADMKDIGLTQNLQNLLARGNAREKLQEQQKEGKGTNSVRSAVGPSVGPFLTGIASYYDKNEGAVGKVQQHPNLPGILQVVKQPIRSGKLQRKKGLLRGLRNERRVSASEQDKVMRQAREWHLKNRNMLQHVMEGSLAQMESAKRRDREDRAQHAPRTLFGTSSEEAALRAKGVAGLRLMLHLDSLIAAMHTSISTPEQDDLTEQCALGDTSRQCRSIVLENALTSY